MKSHVPTVYIVDDDDAVREALGDLLDSVGLSHQGFVSSEAFLAAADNSMQGCLLLDVRMPGMSGLRLQQTLQEHGVLLPVMIITGHGDVPMAVRAMKSGAVDFIEKPFNEQYLLDRIHAILKEDRARWDSRQARDDALARFGALTAREKTVMDLIATGHHTKKIAAQLNIQDRTVDVHRFNIMHKAGVRTLAELLHLWTVAHHPAQR